MLLGAPCGSAAAADRTGNVRTARRTVPCPGTAWPATEAVRSSWPTTWGTALVRFHRVRPESTRQPNRRVASTATRSRRCHCCGVNPAGTTRSRTRTAFRSAASPRS
uniref:(northern house mosquito) hypothetical protein n=1 Tax=Culex pipiens TaxID=7175 RepID=A0A8D8BWJ9_CULPI